MKKLSLFFLLLVPSLTFANSLYMKLRGEFVRMGVHIGYQATPKVNTWVFKITSYNPGNAWPSYSKILSLKPGQDPDYPVGKWVRAIYSNKTKRFTVNIMGLRKAGLNVDAAVIPAASIMRIKHFPDKKGTCLYGYEDSGHVTLAVSNDGGYSWKNQSPVVNLPPGTGPTARRLIRSFGPTHFTYFLYSSIYITANSGKSWSLFAKNVLPKHYSNSREPLQDKARVIAYYEDGHNTLIIFRFREGLNKPHRRLIMRLNRMTKKFEKVVDLDAINKGNIKGFTEITKNRILAWGASGVLVSRDGGDTWKAHKTFKQGVSNMRYDGYNRVIAVPVYQRHVVQRFFISEDKGTTFPSSLSVQLPQSKTGQLYSDLFGNWIYKTNVFWKSQDHGKTWARLNWDPRDPSPHAIWNTGNRSFFMLYSNANAGRNGYYLSTVYTNKKDLHFLDDKWMFFVGCSR